MGVITLRLGDPRGKPSHLIWLVPVSRCLASWNSCAIPNNDDQEQGQIPKFNNMSGWHPIFYTFPLEFHSKKLGEIPPGRWSNSNPGIWSPAWGAAALNPDQLLVMAGRHGPSTTPKTVCYPVTQLAKNHFVCVTKVLLSLLVLFMFVSYGLSSRHGHSSVSRFACWNDFTKDWQGDLKLCCFFLGLTSQYLLQKFMARRDNWGLMLSQEDLLGRRSYWILARDRTACHASASSIMVYHMFWCCKMAINWSMQWDSVVTQLFYESCKDKPQMAGLTSHKHVVLTFKMAMSCRPFRKRMVVSIATMEVFR